MDQGSTATLAQVLPAGWPAGVGLCERDEVETTQAEALRLAAAGERGPVWISARRQTRGRGRSGRSWEMPAGNLAATLLLTPCAEPRMLPGLAIVAGVAVHDAIVRILPKGAPARLKWPNDVLIGRAKVCGILIETSSFACDLVAAVGIGINVAAAPAIAGREATCLNAHGASGLAPTDVLVALAGRMAYWLALWNRGSGFGTVRDAWLERAGALGEPIRVNGAGAFVEGTFSGLDADGALLVGGAGGDVRRVTFGDVALGPAPGS